MHDPPLISVIVPVFNALKFLPTSLESVEAAARHYGNVEIIIVDNGSTDGSREFLEQQRSERLRVLDFPNGNVGGVRNLGASRAEGSFLSFIDVDCTIPVEYFSEALATISREGADATGSPYALPPDAGLLERTWWDIHVPASEGWVSYLNAGNFFCTNEAFQNVGGFDVSLESGEDTELGLRFLKEGYRIYLSYSVCAFHHGNPKSLGQFYRKQIWHGLGALGTFRHKRMDRPLLMTLVHVVLSSGGLVVFTWYRSISAAALAGALVVFSPAITVAFRMIQTRRTVNPLVGIILYELYYLGRATALGLLIAKWMRLGNRDRQTHYDPIGSDDKS